MTTDTLDDLAGRIEQVLAQLTLEEKAALTVGRDAWSTVPVERLGVPSVRMSDGPTGLRKVPDAAEMEAGNNLPATCFPTASALGASWDVDLVRQVGLAIAAEAQAEDVQVLMAPGLNLKRSLLCGRNFEYFSEDPVLTGELAAAYVNGLQANGVGGCVKHFVANESETDRMSTSSEVDERTLRELYLRPFEIAVAKAQPWTLMCAYNRLNGVYCAENPWLLDQVLAQEWGFGGIVVSDWFAVNDRAAGVAAGLHLQMPAAPTAPAVIAAVRAGRLDERRLDEVVGRLLRFVFVAHANRRPGLAADLDTHNRLARRVAAESAVLLKNEGGLLPLEPGPLAGRVAVVGAFAREPRYQGAGSSQVTPARPVETVHDELARLLGAPPAYAAGCTAAGETNAGLLAEAQAVARASQVAVVVVGLPAAFEEEGRDRRHIDLPAGHNALVEAVLAVQPNTVVVLVNGSAVALPWADRVPALLEAWLGGQGSGGAIADVLTGRVNPAGRLAETFPMRLEDTPAYLSFPDDGTGRVPFTEGLFTGYRWYDARQIEPLYAFGHGLSYTTFAYSGLTVGRELTAAGEAVRASLRVRTTGARSGHEVVQLYVADRQPRLPRPRQELKAFAKVFLEPGAETEVSFTLGPRDFAVFDPRVRQWVTGPGPYEVRLGASSRDIRLRATLMLAAPEPVRIPVTRLTPLREWLRDPVGRAAATKGAVALLRLFGVPAEQAEETLQTPSGLNDFITDMPIAKLVMFGVLTEAELERLLADANAD